MNPAARQPSRVKAGDESAHDTGSRRYHQLVQSIDQGFCVIEMQFDAQGRAEDYRFLEVNRAFAQQTGIVNAVGCWMREIAPAHEQHWFDTYGKVATTGESTRFVHAAAALDRWFDVYAFRVDEPERGRVGILFSDVTERLRTERNAEFLAALSQDLVRMRTRAEAGPLIGACLGRHLQLSVCAFVEIEAGQQSTRVISGWHEPDVRPIMDHLHLDQLVEEELWSRVPEGATLVVADVRSEAGIKNATFFIEHHVESFLAVALKVNGRLHQIVLFGRRRASEWRADQVEVAREAAARFWVRMESLEAEHALRLSEERLRIVLESAREFAIFGTDLERNVTSWNPGAERLLGFTEAEVMGKPADVIFTPEDREKGVPAAEAERACREGRATNERWHLRRDGSRFWGSGMVMTMHDRSGRVCGLLKIMRDQTSEQVARQALEQSRRELLVALETTERARAEAVAAGRAKDQFLAALSHELRTPLNPVLMVAGDAAEDESLPPAIRADFDMIRRNIELEARLIDDILDISRVTRGKLALRREDLALHAAIREAAQMVTSLAQQKGLGLALDLAAKEDRVHGDPARLQQILLNLLNNAIKFTPRDGRVTVRTENRDGNGSIVVQIVDTGIGMTEAELARVFLPFVQGSHADVSGASHFGGLGLGLAIVEELVVRHGGAVSASSPGLGKGATFTVELPLAVYPGQPAPATPVFSGVAGGLSILLVEDHGHTRTALARILGQRGHDVVAVGTRREAQQAARMRNFDLLVADLGLPDGSGYSLLGELRRQHPRLEGIAVSGFGMPADLRRSRDAGFAAHLVKPVVAARLDQEIAQVFARDLGGAPPPDLAGAAGT